MGRLPEGLLWRDLELSCYQGDMVRAYEKRMG